jgi:hypothetical protein
MGFVEHGFRRRPYRRSRLPGDGVGEPDHEHETFDPYGVMLEYTRHGWELLAREPRPDSRDFGPDDFGPRATVEDCFRILQVAGTVFTIGCPEPTRCVAVRSVGRPVGLSKPFYLQWIRGRSCGN